MENNNSYKIANGDKKEIYVSFYLLLFGIIMGILVLVVVGHIQWGTILLWSMGIILAFGIYYTKINNRPIRLDIENDGVRLYFKKNRERIVSWNQLKGVYAEEDEGAIRIEKQLRYFSLSKEAAIAIRKAYKEQVGKDAPVWNGNSPLRK